MDVSNLSPPAQAGHCANQGEKIIMLQDPISGQECSLGGLKPELFSYYCIAMCYLLFNLLKGLQIVSCNKPELVLCYQKKKSFLFFPFSLYFHLLSFFWDCTGDLQESSGQIVKDFNNAHCCVTIIDLHQA